MTEIKVKEGEKVRRGDVLYCMDKNIEQKNIDYSEGEIGLLELRITLLNGMLAGKRLTEYRNGNYSAEQREVLEAMISMDEADRLSLEEYEIAVQAAKNQYSFLLSSI